MIHSGRLNPEETVRQILKWGVLGGRKGEGVCRKRV